MGKRNKKLDKLKGAKTFPWLELVSLLEQLEFKLYERAGSRVIFEHEETGIVIHLHKPHPENYLKGGALKSVQKILEKKGDL